MKDHVHLHASCVCCYCQSPPLLSSCLCLCVVVRMSALSSMSSRVAQQSTSRFLSQPSFQWCTSVTKHSLCASLSQFFFMFPLVVCQSSLVLTPELVKLEIFWTWYDFSKLLFLRAEGSVQSYVLSVNLSLMFAIIFTQDHVQNLQSHICKLGCCHTYLHYGFCNVILESCSRLLTRLHELCSGCAIVKFEVIV